ncbi:hypothetical protein FJY63_02790, partial [Candidatus Sumerlaeota bacterium]|nr:hypothetical protein [Candidatus Sumerlaeota bacterium]
MPRFMSKYVGVGLAAALLIGPLAASAQQAGGPPEGQPGPRQGGFRRGEGGPPGERGPVDPAQFRERMVERLRDALGASEEEWKAIRPLIAKVAERQTGRLGGM